MRCLVAEDDQGSRFALDVILKKWGHETFLAEDGGQAWDILQQEPIDCIISDWRMPALEGPDLCEKLRSANFEDYTYFIMLTGKAEVDDLKQAIDVGADDFLQKPVNKEELKARLTTCKRILELQEKLQQKNRALKETFATLDKDLKSAAQMQRNLLPKSTTVIPSANFKWLFHPSEYIGGDIFNYFELDSAHFAFYSLDVAGHGVGSAMLSVSLHQVLTPEFCMYSKDLQQENCKKFKPAHTVVHELNQRFQSGVDSSLYFTIVYGVCNSSTGEVEICQAAHPHPILIKQDGSVSLLGEGGFPVGLIEIAEYDSFKITIKPGEQLILHSDGITECTNPKEEQLGEQRLLDFLIQHKDTDIAETMYELHDFLKDWRGGKYEFSDDISLLAWEYQPQDQ